MSASNKCFECDAPTSALLPVSALLNLHVRFSHGAEGAMTKSKCWICGDIALSKEHRLKKTDIVRAYGRGPYRGDSAPVHVHEGKQSPVQGPDANTLKYKPSLCPKCNTTTTQPFDQAYDIFVSWLFENESVVLYRRYVNFSDVYGQNFPEKQRDLYK